MNWQPIETAPRDATRILCANTGRHLIEVLEFHHGCWLRYPDDVNWGRSPTHWMPLPQPPDEGYAERYVIGTDGSMKVEVPTNTCPLRGTK